ARSVVGQAGSLGGAGRIRVAIGQGICLEELCHPTGYSVSGCSGCQGARVLCRNQLHCWLWSIKTQTFIGCKEEQFVLDDRPAKSPAEIILLYHTSMFSRRIQEPVVRVQHGVAQVIERIAVERVRAAPSHD